MKLIPFPVSYLTLAHIKGQGWGKQAEGGSKNIKPTILRKIMHLESSYFYMCSISCQETNIMKLTQFPVSYLTLAHIKVQIKGKTSSWSGFKKHKVDNIEESNAFGEIILLMCSISCQLTTIIK